MPDFLLWSSLAGRDSAEREKERMEKGRPLCTCPRAQPAFIPGKACVPLLSGLAICVLIITGKEKQTQWHAVGPLDARRPIWGLFYVTSQQSWLLRIPFHNKYVK